MTGAPALSLERTHDLLGWPAPDAITHPSGAGASVFASLVRNKIGRALQRLCDGDGTRVGVLMANPDARSSEPPLAVVAEFRNGPDETSLRELQRLCWNFSHVPILVTIEPSLLRVWSCCEAPDKNRALEDYLVRELRAEELQVDQAQTLELQAARALHWINLVSGAFFSDHSARFDRDGRADQMLLGNLRYIRDQLSQLGLTNDDICHDLLARIIFVQFLFDRKDQDGNPALTVASLHRLKKEGLLSNVHDSFHGLLSDYEDTYRLFDWLNAKFNGDLFPGKGVTPEERAVGWKAEKKVVKPNHLGLLADFIRGDLDMPARQMCLWPQYAFDVIPLEFISSIYETFVTERAARGGIFYTPPYLVDFVLDDVLPWDGSEWDLRIIDPACGSGIFLVKAFQRLVHRWKNANPDKPIRAETLRRLLERNIFGVDIDTHAVRVACFSLYLAMCDELEPRHYWTQVTFPSMRQRRLICADFFDESHDGFRSKDDNQSYDLVVGNAPWGDGVITQTAKEWATDPEHEWPVANNDIGSLFLAKAAVLSKPEGRIAMIQSANSLLFNISGSAVKFRKTLFAQHRVRKIYNLSALRFRVFKRKTHTNETSVSPCCVAILERAAPRLDNVIIYVSPKHTVPLLDEFTIVIEPQDRKTLTVSEAIDDPAIWSKLMWGARRDLQLVDKLKSFPTVGEIDGLVSRQGVKFGDRQKIIAAYENMQIFNDRMFPADAAFPFLDVAGLPRFGKVAVHSRASTDVAAFTWPQLIVKQSWNKPSRRFHARLTRSSRQVGLLCNESYYSLHSARRSDLEAACMVFNSHLAVYFLLLTSGRFVFIPKPSKSELLGLPLPTNSSSQLNEISSDTEIDPVVFDLFHLKDAERVLIEDLMKFTLSDFLEGERSVGRQRTNWNGDEAHIRLYCSYFIRVLKAGFGADKTITATIFQSEKEDMPYRLIAFTLGGATTEAIDVKKISSAQLLNKFEKLNLASKDQDGGIYNQRFVRIYDASGGAPTVFIIKPDQMRFWTRSTGLQDADEVALDLFTWGQDASKGIEAVQ
ncbi:MAG: N-6 DNA methylase [Acidobacteria bacterium]|nr:N-6 DNA methylase [Acidobacteriota bacterium]